MQTSTTKMRISTILSFTFIGASVAAATPIKRDLATFQNAFGAVSRATITFDNGIKALTSASDVTAALPDLTSKAAAIVSALSSGTTAVNNSPALSLGDSISLLSLSSTLANNVDTTITDLSNKKSYIDAAGQTSFVLTQLQNVKAASQTFIAAVVAKVPSAVQNIANTQAQQVITALNRGITTFGGTV
jgi:hypothetical protein